METIIPPSASSQSHPRSSTDNMRARGGAELQSDITDVAVCSMCGAVVRDAQVEAQHGHSALAALFIGLIKRLKLEMSHPHAETLLTKQLDETALFNFFIFCSINTVPPSLTSVRFVISRTDSPHCRGQTLPRSSAVALHNPLSCLSISPTFLIWPSPSGFQLQRSSGTSDAI